MERSKPWNGRQTARRTAIRRSRPISRPIIDESPDAAFLYARTVETALRTGTIVAAGRLDSDHVSVPDLEYGIGMATRSSHMMAEGAADYMAENENQANAQ